MKRKGIWIVISLLAVLGLLMGGFGCAPAGEVTPDDGTPDVVVIPEDAEPIYIGFVAPLSGIYSAIGEDMLDGTMFAVKEFNEAGGVLGRPVELIVRDSKFGVESDPTAAYCKEWIDKYNVAFITGGYSDTTGETVQANSVYRGVPFISLVPAAAPCTRGAKIHPYKFTGNINCDEFNFGWLPYLQVNNLVHQKWFLLGPDYGWGWGMCIGAKNVVEQYGGEVLKTTYTVVPCLDMAPYVAEFEELIPDGNGTIYNVNVGTEDVAFIKAVYNARLLEKGYTVTDLTAEVSSYHFGLADPKFWAGVYTSSLWYYGLPEARDFAVKYYNEYEDLPDWASGRLSYFQAYWGLKAIEETGTLDAAVWTEWLRGRRLSGATDTLEKFYDPVTGRLVQEMYACRYKQPEDMVDIFPGIPELGPEWDHLEVLHRSTADYTAAITTDEDELADIPEGDPRIGAGVRPYWEAYCEEHGLEMPPNLQE